MSIESDEALDITAAWSGELPAALDLVFTQVPASERSARVSNALALFHAGEIDARGVFVARRRDGTLEAVFVCQALAGSTGLVWLPEARETVPALLVRRGLDWLRARGCKLAQLIVPPSREPKRLESLRQAGFRSTGPLLYLQHPLHTLRLPQIAEPYRFVDASQVPEVLLAHTVERTYVGTLDFPELSGLRTMAEVLSGHRAAGRVLPGAWLVALHQGEPVGVMLLTEREPLEEWDLTYLGVVPEFRRRGLARALVVHGLHRVEEGGGTQLEVAVDARNRPAYQLYASLGFVPRGEREVYLCPFVASDTTVESTG